MNKYIILSWPEVQKFMDNERWSECRALISDDAEYAIPEDLYEEVMYKLQFPKKYEDTNLGTIVCYETRAIVNGEETFWYDQIKRNNVVLVYVPKEDKWVITKCVACSFNMPIMLEENWLLPGLNCQIIGSYNPENNG